MIWLSWDGGPRWKDYLFYKIKQPRKGFCCFGLYNKRLYLLLLGKMKIMHKEEYRFRLRHIIAVMICYLQMQIC